VRRDYLTIIENVKGKSPDAEIIGVLVEKMVSPATEVIIGGLRDPQFGPAIMFGLGGIFTEVLKDISFRLAPITKKEAFEMMRDLRGYPLLNGFRGGSPLDMESLSHAIISVSEVMTMIAEIQEIDLNPVFLYTKGLVAVDARIILRVNDQAL